MIKALKKQKGFTLTPALFILSLMMIGGTTYLLYINSSSKSVRKLETANVAKYAAETGLLQMKSQFARLNAFDASEKVINKWYNAKNFDSTYIFHSSAIVESDRNETNTNRTSDYIYLKNGSNHANSSYKITIEDGSLISGKTVTGSATQGVDRYGNKIWSDTINKNYSSTKSEYRYGVKVDGFSLDMNGNRDKSSQSIYAVIDVPNSASSELMKDWSAGSPAGFLLSTNGKEPLPIPNTYRYLNLISGLVITGPIHSNNRIDFTWNGNWDVFNQYKPNLNDNFTVRAIRDGAANTAENPHPLIRKIVRETTQSSNQITVYGNNFSTDYTKNVAYFNGSSTGIYSINPASSTKIAFNVPVTDFPLKSVTVGIIGNKYLTSTPIVKNAVTYRNPSSKYNDPISALIPIEIPVVPVDVPPPMKVYGVHYVSSSGTGSQIYNLGTNYLYYDSPYNFLAWNPSGIEPATNSYYYASYFTEENPPHNKIKVFAPITSDGTQSKLYYEHAHRVDGGSIIHPFSDDHGHEPIFGNPSIKLSNITTANYYDSLYDWNSLHWHEVENYNSVLGYTPIDTVEPMESDPNDLFFFYPDKNFRPKSVSPKVSPILAPNNVNSKTQRTYPNQLFKIMLNKTLSQDVNGDPNSLDEIAEDRANGYYNANGGMINFRATYFGNDLKYSAGAKKGKDVLPKGSTLDETATIYVDDNPFDDPYITYSNPITYDTSDKTKIHYMTVTDVPTTGYKAYTYRQIPKNGMSISSDGKSSDEGGIIFVREGTVRLGGMDFKGAVQSTAYVSSTSPSTFGNATIIDGRLTIVSYSEVKPSVYVDNDLNSSNDNRGDIVITGNIIYKNRISPTELEVAKKDYNYTGFRQYKSSTFTDINRNPLTILPESEYITLADGKLSPDKDSSEKINSLALIASNDIKIPVGHYRQPDVMESKYTTPAEEIDTSKGCPCKDTLTIHGQLIAGHKITQTKITDNEANKMSKNDRVILYGSYYSYEPPNLSYFGRSDPSNRAEDGLGRAYLYDKTLAEMPLAGSPRFPKDNTYSNESYPVVSSGLPRIVPGTWKMVSDGSQ